MQQSGDFALVKSDINGSFFFFFKGVGEVVLLITDSIMLDVSLA